MAIKQAIKKDLAGENKAIKDYGTRIRQTKGSFMAPTLEEIRGDEVDHKKRLEKVLKGLKSASPTSKE